MFITKQDRDAIEWIFAYDEDTGIISWRFPTIHRTPRPRIHKHKRCKTTFCHGNGKQYLTKKIKKVLLDEMEFLT